MSEPVSDQPTSEEPEYGTEEWAEAKFPDRGAPPSNDVSVDPTADVAPNVGDHG